MASGSAPQKWELQLSKKQRQLLRNNPVELGHSSPKERTWPAGGTATRPKVWQCWGKAGCGALNSYSTWSCLGCGLGFKRKEPTNQSNKDKGAGHNNKEKAGTRSADQHPPSGGDADPKAEQGAADAGGQGRPGTDAAATMDKLQESLELLKPLLSQEALAEVTLSLQKQKETDAAQRSAGSQPPQEESTPSPDSVPTPTKIVSKWAALGRISRMVDRKQKSVEKAQAELTKAEVALMAATEAHQKAQDWLSERQKALAEAKAKLAEAELEAKTAPSVLPSQVTEAPTAGEVSAMLVLGEQLLQGKPAPSECPGFIHKVVCGFIKAYGEEKFLKAAPPDADMQLEEEEAQLADDRAAAQPGSVLPGASSTGAGAAAGSLGALAATVPEGPKSPSPDTPPLRPDTKKPRIGGNPLGEVAAIPTAIPAFNGGAGLGRGLFETPTLTAANLAHLPGTKVKEERGEAETVRSRTRSRASSPAPSSKSAPLPTELGNTEEVREVEEEQDK
jgi:hypothetical protein